MILLNHLNYKRLFEELYEPLCNLAFSVLGDYDASEDVVQEVFVHLWQLRKKLEIKTNVKSYLYSAVRNKAIEKLRRQKLDDKYILITKATQLLFEEEDTGDIEKFIFIEKLYSAIDKLPDKCRMVFKMAKLDGMTYNEISQELNLSVKTIESQMRRAFILLRDMLKDV